MKKWIEAMRLRTLPVGLSGTLLGVALGRGEGGHIWPLGVICLLFALCAQIASNFANEYFDYRDGIDTPGRQGFRRGVSEGDISPRAMLRATFLTLAAAACLGVAMLLISREWWLLLPGVAIMLGVLAYSAGPWPLSRHALGDVAVLVFYGVVPVMLTAYLEAPSEAAYAWEEWLMAGCAAGLLGINVLIVNNYRDMEEDSAAGKHTTVTLFGRHTMRMVYLLCGLLAVILLSPLWNAAPVWVFFVAVPLYLTLHISLWARMKYARGSALNKVLGQTAIAMAFMCVMASVGVFL